MIGIEITEALRLVAKKPGIANWTTSPSLTGPDKAQDTVNVLGRPGRRSDTNIDVFEK